MLRQAKKVRAATISVFKLLDRNDRLWSNLSRPRLAPDNAALDRNAQRGRNAGVSVNRLFRESSHAHP